MLGQNVERSNKNHKIIPFSLSLCLLSAATTLWLIQSQFPFGAYFERKYSTSPAMFRPIMNVGGDHGTPPNVPE